MVEVAQYAARSCSDHRVTPLVIMMLSPIRMWLSALARCEQHLCSSLFSTENCLCDSNCIKMPAHQNEKKEYKYRETHTHTHTRTRTHAHFTEKVRSTSYLPALPVSSIRTHSVPPRTSDSKSETTLNKSGSMAKWY